MTGRVYVCMYVWSSLSANSPCIDDLTPSCALTGTSGGQGGQFEGRYSGRSGYCSNRYFFLNYYYSLFISYSGKMNNFIIVITFFIIYFIAGMYVLLFVLKNSMHRH